MDLEIRWEYQQYACRYRASLLGAVLYISDDQVAVRGKEEVLACIKTYLSAALDIDVKYADYSLDADNLLTSSIEQLKALGLDLTEEEYEVEPLPYLTGSIAREAVERTAKIQEEILKSMFIGERYLIRGTADPSKIDLSPGAIHINPHMASPDQEEPETWVVGDSHKIEWFDETLEDEYNEMLKEKEEDFGINTADKVDGAKALDILKGLI